MLTRATEGMKVQFITEADTEGQKLPDGIRGEQGTIVELFSWQGDRMVDVKECDESAPVSLIMVELDRGGFTNARADWLIEMAEA